MVDMTRIICNYAQHAVNGWRPNNPPTVVVAKNKSHNDDCAYMVGLEGPNGIVFAKYVPDPGPGTWDINKAAEQAVGEILAYFDDRRLSEFDCDDVIRWLKRDLEQFSTLETHAEIRRSTEDYRYVLTIHLYTAVNCYRIVARDGNKTYLGCSASARTPRPGEHWTRGNDLPDGDISPDTWHRIITAIVSYEMVRLSRTAVAKADQWTEAEIESFSAKFTDKQFDELKNAATRIGPGMIAPIQMPPNYANISEQDKAKGAVKPIRTTYVHAGPKGPMFPLEDLKGHYPPEDGRDYAAFERYPSNSPIVGKYWTAEDLERADKGCGGTTVMSEAEALQYAQGHRETEYLCRGCNAIAPAEDFVWYDSDERLNE